MGVGVFLCARNPCSGEQEALFLGVTQPPPISNTVELISTLGYFFLEAGLSRTRSSHNRCRVLIRNGEVSGNGGLASVLKVLKGSSSPLPRRRGNGARGGGGRDVRTYL